jgi:hypothetical protein
MRSRKINCPICTLFNKGVGKSWCRCWLRYDERCDAVATQNVGGHRANRLSEKTRIATDDNTCAQKAFERLRGAQFRSQPATRLRT